MLSFTIKVSSETQSLAPFIWNVALEVNIGGLCGLGGFAFGLVGT